MPSDQIWNRDGLPAWSYRSSSIFDLEKNRVFLNHWHVVGHVNDLQGPGDWLSFDLLGDSEKALREHHDMLRGLIPELNNSKA